MKSRGALISFAAATTVFAIAQYGISRTKSPTVTSEAHSLTLANKVVTIKQPPLTMPQVRPDRAIRIRTPIAFLSVSAPERLVENQDGVIEVKVSRNTAFPHDSAIHVVVQTNEFKVSPTEETVLPQSTETSHQFILTPQSVGEKSVRISGRLDLTKATERIPSDIEIIQPSKTISIHVTPRAVFLGLTQSAFQNMHTAALIIGFPALLLFLVQHLLKARQARLEDAKPRIIT